MRKNKFIKYLVGGYIGAHIKIRGDCQLGVGEKDLEIEFNGVRIGMECQDLVESSLKSYVMYASVKIIVSVLGVYVGSDIDAVWIKPNKAPLDLQLDGVVV